MVTILIMSAKMATLALLKIELFLNNSYDVRISDTGVTKKTLPNESNYIVGVVMRLKFGTSGISMREVIISIIVIIVTIL